jgi:hypothetical protein
MQERRKPMSWLSSGGAEGEKKFLVDLQSNTFISDKAHQEIIDRAGLNPSGYDNYLKGWVKPDGTIKIWVETIEDIVFRYWDQLKLGMRVLMGENLIHRQNKIFAIVNRVERFAGMVKDLLTSGSKDAYFDKKLGHAIQFYGHVGLTQGSEVMLLANYRVKPNHYIYAGTRGNIVYTARSNAKRVRVVWQQSASGYKKPRGRVTLLTDLRIVVPVKLK